MGIPQVCTPNAVEQVTMLLIPFGVVWAGYTAIWFGMCTLQAPPSSLANVGLLDLILPSRVGKFGTLTSSPTTMPASSAASQAKANAASGAIVPTVGPGTSKPLGK